MVISHICSRPYYTLLECYSYKYNIRDENTLSNKKACWRRLKTVRNSKIFFLPVLIVSVMLYLTYVSGLLLLSSNSSFPASLSHKKDIWILPKKQTTVYSSQCLLHLQQSKVNTKKRRRQGPAIMGNMEEIRKQPLKNKVHRAVKPRRRQL